MPYRHMSDHQPLHHYEHFNVRTWLKPKILQYFYHTVQKQRCVSDNTMKGGCHLSLTLLYNMYPITP